MKKLYDLIEKYKTRRFLIDLVNIVEDDSNLLNFVLKKTKFLNDSYKNISISQRMYHIWFKIFKVHLCEICNNPARFIHKTSFSKILEKNYSCTCENRECQKKYNYISTLSSLKKIYGDDITNFSQTKEWRNKVKKTNNEKYGCDWQVQSDNFKIKAQKTWIKKYNVDCPLKSKVLREKGYKTNFKKYGCKIGRWNPEIAKQTQETNIKKYGFIHPLQSDIIQNKIKQTSLIKYGVEHYQQSSFAKLAGYKWYNYTLPSGRIVEIQGYENIFLDEYFKNGGYEDNILINNNDISDKIGIIYYYNIDDNKKHRYFPDFYLIKENTIVEVKSTWTYKASIHINKLKEQACINKGLNFIYKIYNSKKEIINIE